ncbi:hypothetical protein HDU92_005855 [Lobulomyces angularis]|nr:hypothetical protein HDU92_005855 [Lobulomyces angularis]
MIDDLPPPLEDCTELLKKREKAKSKNQQKFEKIQEKPKIDASVDSSLLDIKEDSNILNFSNKPLEKKPAVSQSNNSGQFGGLKKGFFDSKPKEKVKNKITEKNLENVSFNPNKGSSLVIEEVQENLKSENSPSNITSQLLNQINLSPSLMKAFEDPEFALAAEEISKNPTRETMEKFKKLRPELFKAFLEFLNLMGQEVEKKEKKEEKVKVVDKEVENLLKADGIKELLLDFEVQEIVESLRQGKADVNGYV